MDNGVNREIPIPTIASSDIDLLTFALYQEGEMVRCSGLDIVSNILLPLSEAYINNNVEWQRDSLYRVFLVPESFLQVVVYFQILLTAFNLYRRYFPKIVTWKWLYRTHFTFFPSDLHAYHIFLR